MLEQVRLFSIVLVLSLSAGGIGAGRQNTQANSTADMAAAFDRMQAKDYAGAAAILETLTKREPRNARAWRNLGNVYHHLKRYDEAISAYRTSLQIDPQSPGAAYNLGCSYSQKGDRERTFEYLTRAKAMKMDMTQLEADPDLAPLKSDPRFAALLPRPTDFENPFVEPVTVVREWDGEAANDQFGWIARVVGDVDGDGVPDIVTAVPGKAAGGANAGRVYVYSRGQADCSGVSLATRVIN
jgi:tetratricopeptide (TPR) repeat protein